MNNVSLVGVITTKLQIAYTNKNNVPILNFTIGMNRDVSCVDGKKIADYVQCTAVGIPAETMYKYLRKGSTIGIIGRIQTNSWVDKFDVKCYKTYVFVKEFKFIDKYPDFKDPMSATIMVEDEEFEVDEDSLPFGI